MYRCSKCGESVSLEDLIMYGTVGNSESTFCPTCTKNTQPLIKEMGKRFPNPCSSMRRYISLVIWRIDPAGVMYLMYLDKNLIMRRK
jgi:hypothetical protein